MKQRNEKDLSRQHIELASAPDIPIPTVAPVSSHYARELHRLLIPIT